MATTIKWIDNNTIETAHKIYKSSSYFTKDNLPVPLVELGPDITEYVDSAGVDGENWYIVSALLNDYEVFSEPFIAGLATAYIHDVFGDGSAVATYNFDGDGSDLSTTYSATLGSTSTFDAGVIDQAVVTNGTSTGGVGNVYNLDSLTCGLSCWMSTTSVLNYGAFSFAAFNISSTGGVAVFDSPTGNGSGINYPIDTTLYPTDGSFFHIVISLDSGIPTVYINGVMCNFGTTSAIAHSTVVGIGAIGAMGGGYYYAAKYDQLRLFNRALTQAEVNILYQEGAQYL